MFSTRDNNPIYRVSRKQRVRFYSTGGVKMFGIVNDGATFLEGRYPFNEMSPVRTIQLPLESFLRQRVLCREGEWVTRQDIIAYSSE